MNSISYNPFRSGRVRSFDQLLDEIVATPLSDLFGTSFVSDSPSVNIVESEQDYLIHVAAPGLNKGDFDVLIEEDELIVSGKKEQVDENKEKGKYTRREFNYQTFKRRFHLSEDLNRESIAATYADGILTINIDKSQEPENKTQTIEIS